MAHFKIRSLLTVEFEVLFARFGYQSNVPFANSFSPSVACLPSLNIVFQRTDILDFNEVQFKQIFLLWVFLFLGGC